MATMKVLVIKPTLFSGGCFHKTSQCYSRTYATEDWQSYIWQFYGKYSQGLPVLSSICVSPIIGKAQKLFGNSEERKLRFRRGIGNAQSDFNPENLLLIT
jgi:hypothetical protein